MVTQLIGGRWGEGGGTKRSLETTQSCHPWCTTENNNISNSGKTRNTSAPDIECSAKWLYQGIASVALTATSLIKVIH